MIRTAIPALVRRELQENRVAFVWTPGVLVSLMLLLLLAGLLALGRHGEGGQIIFEMGKTVVRSANGLSLLLRELADHSPGEQKLVITGLLHALTVPALIAVPFVVFFTLLSSLYEERRDRSILFWKSMPVPDWAEVGVKFLAATVLAPAIVLGFAILAQLVAWVILLLVAWGVGASLTPWMTALPVVAYQWLVVAVALGVWALWAAPVWGWVLFCSAFAPRTPFGFAVVPPIVLLIVEGMFFRTHHFAEWLGRHLFAFPLFRGFSRGEVSADELLTLKLVNLLSSLAEPGLWVGLLIAAFFLAAATWLRRHAL
ncbi:MAG: hypothetical protein D6740_08475 [Alphaproteobacteria bacterium]|nr:MAG: hypothetical protein D6740_08475 [Alphaproteobacteria bacterium]